MLKTIANVITAIGFVILLGTAGASDRGTMTLHSILIWGSVSLMMMVVGYAVSHSIEKKGGDNYDA